MNRLIDLHMHSLYSNDGEFTPAELMLFCHERGVKLAALTDHNCVRGVLQAKQAAEQYGIRLVSGVELDCTLQEINLHLLGYGIDAADERYKALEENILEQERCNASKRMALIQEAGIVFNEQEAMALSRDGSVTGEMIAEMALADKRNINNTLLSPYRDGGSRSDNPYVNFYWDFCSQGKVASLPMNYPSFDEANALIQETGGFSVLAHPSITIKRQEELIQYMIKEGLAGIEVYSSYHTLDDIIYYTKWADEHRLFKTIGSDFHGKTKPSVELGLGDGEYGQEALLLQITKWMEEKI